MRRTGERHPGTDPARRPPEPADTALRALRHGLLRAAVAVRRREWRQLTPTGPTGPTGSDGHRSLLCWTWTRPEARHLVVANHFDRAARARLPLAWSGLRGPTVRLTDRLTGEAFDRERDELAGPGLLLELPPWGTRVLAVG